MEGKEVKITQRRETMVSVKQTMEEKREKSDHYGPLGSPRGTPVTFGEWGVLATLNSGHSDSRGTQGPVPGRAYR